ncbi:MAG TPA: hypothetical protein VK154_14405 [Chitinophagales bacterium]|nr:hypothetical protein [Chitinophagales bacterium]
MKNKIALLFLLLLSATTFSQANKPAVGDWGIRYGVFFNGGFGQQLTFTRMLKKNLEVGLGVTATFQMNKQTTNNLVTVDALNGVLPAERELTTVSNSLNIALNPFLLYHFPIKSNLDLYMGGGVNVGVNSSLRNSSVTRIHATDYEMKEEEAINNSPTIYGGASAIIGCQYFFYKNLAIGAQAGFGFSAGGSTGKAGSKTITTNSGALNPIQGEVIEDSNVTFKQTTASAGIAGNVGLNLTFYFARVTKAKQAVN